MYFKVSHLYLVVDCKWGPWSETLCSQSCGSSAFKTMTREKVQKAAYGGQKCSGEASKKVKCDFKPCPSK